MSGSLFFLCAGHGAVNRGTKAHREVTNRPWLPHANFFSRLLRFGECVPSSDETCELGSFSMVEPSKESEEEKIPLYRIDPKAGKVISDASLRGHRENHL